MLCASLDICTELLFTYVALKFIQNELNNGIKAMMCITQNGSCFNLWGGGDTVRAHPQPLRSEFESCPNILWESWYLLVIERQFTVQNVYRTVCTGFLCPANHPPQ